VVAATPMLFGKVAQLPPCGIRKLTFRSDLRITSADAGLCVDGEERPSVRSRRLCSPRRLGMGKGAGRPLLQDEPHKLTRRTASRCTLRQICVGLC